MRPFRWNGLILTILVAALVTTAFTSPADSACCYFSAKDKDILQPAQKAFLTYDPAAKVETFTVQPKFEGNALDFGMVIPTPSRPKLDPMPRDFFKHLAVYTILRRREFPRSNLVFPNLGFGALGGAGAGIGGIGGIAGGIGGFGGVPARPPAVQVLETGLVGSLEYKILDAGRADDLYQWLKDN